MKTRRNASRRSRGVILLPLLLAPTVFWGGLAGWAGINGWRAQRWARSETLTPGGVRRGCEAYTIGRGDRAVLFVHGFADSPAVFTNMASELASRGFACRAMRLPGFGQTPAALTMTTLDDWKTSVTQEASRLRQGHGKVWIVGHSLGATVALQCAAESPGLADGLVLLAPLVEVSSSRSPVLPAKAWYDLAQAALPRDAVVYNALPIDGVSEDARRYALRDRFFPLCVYGEVFRAAEGLDASVLDRVTAPVLVVLPAHDQVTDRLTAERYFTKRSGSPIRILRLLNSGHVIPLDNEWRSVDEEIARAVARNSVGESRAL